jgi:hypothetical protein
MFYMRKLNRAHKFSGVVHEKYVLSHAIHTKETFISVNGVTVNTLYDIPAMHFRQIISQLLHRANKRKETHKNRLIH